MWVVTKKSLVDWGRLGLQPGNQMDRYSVQINYTMALQIHNRKCWNIYGAKVWETIVKIGPNFKMSKWIVGAGAVGLQDKIGSGQICRHIKQNGIHWVN